METTLSWIATVATIVAATITASNLGSRITGYGFIVFLVGSIAWFALGLTTGQPALVWTNAALTILNLFGIWRWLGRQAKVEEGARAGGQASETTPGEALFPVSLLTRAKVRASGREIATCVDAMAGCNSGRIAYLTVAEGGVAGAGETFRRLPWSAAHADGDEIVTSLDQAQFQALDPVPKDQWPAR